jgi:hypothetical protein
MAFKGRDPVRTKIVMDNKTIEQVKSFKYLGKMISYERELDIHHHHHHVHTGGLGVLPVPSSSR